MKLGFKLIGALLLALFLWEIILEVSILRFPGAYHHPILGKVLWEGVYVQGKEGYCFSRINNFGFRGENIQTKENNEYRIMLLGDSFTEAFQVQDKKTFCYLLKKQLQLNSDLLINTINAGKSGASPAAFIYFADYYNKVINPDFVVVQISDHDFSNDIFSKSSPVLVINYQGNYRTVLNKNLNSDDFSDKYPKYASLIKPLCSVSVFRLGMDVFRKIVAGKQNQQIHLNQPSPGNYQSIISWTIKSLKEKYPRLVILYLPSSYIDKKKDPTAIEKNIKSEVINNGITFINMRDYFTNYYFKYHQPVTGFHNTAPGEGHLNKIGHQLVATALANYFKGQIPK